MQKYIIFSKSRHTNKFFVAKAGWRDKKEREYTIIPMGKRLQTRKRMKDARREVSGLHQRHPISGRHAHIFTEQNTIIYNTINNIAT